MPWSLRRRTLRRLMVASLIVLSACSSAKKNLVPDPDAPTAMEEATRPSIPDNEVSSEDVEKNIEQPYQSAFGEIGMDDNEHVHRWINYFQGRGRGYMEQYLSRSTRYLPMMKNVLRENGLPEDLVYIALIESGFSPKAHSRANAVGYWQFIRSTGKRFGLRIDPFTDERRDPVLSTRAAADYFKALYTMLGSWHLSMAAYNVGEMRVKRAVNRYHTKVFWELMRQRRSFPAETKQYVPKFIAAVMIARDPKAYGFTDLTYEDPLSYDTVALVSPISLTKLANNIGVDVEELQLLNPKFRTDFVPIAKNGETVVRIPVGRSSDALAALSLSVTTQPKILQAEYYYYRIRRGDTLSTVARKHRTTVSQLRRLNELSNRTMMRVGRSIKVPDPGGDGIRYASADAPTPAEAKAKGREVATSEADSTGKDTHVVRRGENLSVIANKYGLKVADLLKWNGLGNRSVLRKGQRLRLRDRGAQNVDRRQAAVAVARAGGRAQKVAREVASKRHVVRRGETLYDVSKRYGITMGDLARANRVKVSHRTLAGERLLIPN